MKNRRNIGRKIFLVALTVGVMVFYALFGFKAEQQPDPQQTEVTEKLKPVSTDKGTKQYLVVFWNEDGEQINDQVIDENGRPEEFEMEADGIRVAYWKNSSGDKVDAFNTPVTDDVFYYAVMAPTFSVHKVYLFANEDGLIMPDEYLTYQDLNTAVELLTECDPDLLPEVKYVPGTVATPAPEVSPTASPEISPTVSPAASPKVSAEPSPTVSPKASAEPTTSPAAAEKKTEKISQDVPIPVSELKTVLAEFCGTENFKYPNGEYITRRRFAVEMNKIMGRDGENVTASEKAYAFVDLPMDDADYADIMEAACPHEVGGRSWSEQRLTVNQVGFVLGKGKLYYVDENGTVARDTDVGLLHFDENGVFTSENDELDGYVRDIIAKLQSENPDADREELLRAAYNYCRDSFEYSGKKSYTFGATGWEISDALEMFSEGKGNCYNYAAAFWALSGGLGYESVAVSGTISQSYQPHGWVIMNLDGKYYYFDCVTEMIYRSKGDTGKNMFKMERANYMVWTYRRPEKIGI